MSQWNGPGRVDGQAWLNAGRDRPHRPRLGRAGLLTGALTLVRAGYGVGLVCVPQLLIRWTGNGDPSQRACAVARVLGMRHLAQAALITVARFANPMSRVPVACGAGVDLLHAGTMVGLATVDPAARRAALVDVGMESTFGVAGIVAAGGLSGSHGRDMSRSAGQRLERGVK